MVSATRKRWSVGDCCASRADRPFVFTKCGLAWDAEQPMRARPPRLSNRDHSPGVDASLRRLGVERIDLYQFHWPDESGVPVEDSWGAMLDSASRGRCAGSASPTSTSRCWSDASSAPCRLAAAALLLDQGVRRPSRCPGAAPTTLESSLQPDAVGPAHRWLLGGAGRPPWTPMTGAGHEPIPAPRAWPATWHFATPPAGRGSPRRPVADRGSGVGAELRGRDRSHRGGPFPAQVDGWLSRR